MVGGEASSKEEGGGGEGYDAWGRRKNEGR